MAQGRLLLALGHRYARSSRATAAATALTRALETFTAQDAVPWMVRTLHALADLHAGTGDLA